MCVKMRHMKLCLRCFFFLQPQNGLCVNILTNIIVTYSVELDLYIHNNEISDVLGSKILPLYHNIKFSLCHKESLICLITVYMVVLLNESSFKGLNAYWVP